MKQVGVFGSSGMLGAYVKSYFEQQGYNVICFARTDVITALGELKEKFKATLRDKTFIINCVGVIKPQVAVQGVAETIRINSLFPHILSDAASSNGHSLIHVTTDCVFSGKTGGYSEESLHDELDIYGRTKSLGEPANCTVIRTSIIGEERNNARSLIEWAKSQAGKDVKGFVNHTWNGVTCLQFAKVAHDLIESGMTWQGVRHVFSPTAVNKFELMQLINDAFRLGLKISAFEPENPCYRTLSSNFPEVVKSFKIPELKQQLLETKNFKWE